MPERLPPKPATSAGQFDLFGKRGMAAEVPGAERAFAGGARAALALRAAGPLPAGLRFGRAAGRGRAADRLRATQRKARARGPLRPGAQAQAAVSAPAD